jgi:type II secretory pathway component PulF
MFTSRLSLTSLIPFCRALRHQMQAGLTLAQAMKHQGKKGPLAVRPVAERIAERLVEGESFKAALKEERDRFPPLFLTLSAVAEETGQLPEVLREIEEYFELQVQQWKKFLSMIAWPAFQFVMAILVMALLIWLLGMIAGNDKPVITVFGLYGGTHAVLFLLGWVALIVGIGAGYWLLKEVLRSGGLIDSILLQIPVIGGCMRTFAIGRFSMGMALTMEAGVPIPDAARLSLYATGNGGFDAQGKKVAKVLKEGQTLTMALKETALFPEDYLSAVDNAEESGMEPDVFRRLAEQYHENGTRAMKLLTMVAGGLVWFLVASMIIYFIYSLLTQMWGVTYGDPWIKKTLDGY